jgi:hypothetical protein
MSRSAPLSKFGLTRPAPPPPPPPSRDSFLAHEVALHLALMPMLYASLVNASLPPLCVSF